MSRMKSEGAEAAPGVTADSVVLFAIVIESSAEANRNRRHCPIATGARLAAARGFRLAFDAPSGPNEAVGRIAWNVMRERT